MTGAVPKPFFHYVPRTLGVLTDLSGFHEINTLLAIILRCHGPVFIVSPHAYTEWFPRGHVGCDRAAD